MDFSSSLIIVVDDNPVNLKVIEETLVPLHVEIIIASSGSQCLEILKKERPTLFILDVMMPEMDGYTLYEKIRENPQFRNNPIMFITALNDSDSETRGIELGAVDFITKPINPGLVRSRVANLLRLQQYQKKLEDRASLKEEQFKKLFLNSPIAQLLIAYKDLSICEANFSAQTLFGYTIPELCKLTPLDISTDKQIDGIPAYDYGQLCYSRSLSGEIDSFEWFHQNRDGEILICDIRVMPFPGEEEVFIASIIDITKRRRSEEAAIKANKSIQSIMDSMPFSLIGVTSDLTISHWNRFIQDLTGLGNDEVINRDLLEIIPYLKLEKELILSSIDQTIVNRVDMRERIGPRGTIYENIVIFPLSEEKSGAVILIEDITKNVSLKKKVAQTEGLVPLGDMISGIIHEVTNPLAGVIQNSQSLEKRLGDSIPGNIASAEECGIELDRLKQYLEDRKVYKMIHSIRESGIKAVQIIRNLQSFVRFDSGAKTKCSIFNLVEQALELAESDFNIINKADFKTISRTIDIADNLPLVMCESSKILQMLTNVFIFCEKNIALSKDSGYLTITAYDEGDCIYLLIKDNGVPINQKDLEEYKNLSYDNRKRGYWYYLNMSSFIVEELHGGKFIVESFSDGNQYKIGLPL